MTKHRKAAAFVTALLIGNGTGCPAAISQSSGIGVEFESPLAAAPPLQGYLRLPNGAGPSPAVVLLHGCSGDWRRLDEGWGKLISSWGYVALTVDSFSPRGLSNTCDSSPSAALAFDAFRSLNYLVQQQPVDPARIAVLGFAQGGWLALLSVERGNIEQTSRNKFRAAIAFYPPCLGFKGNMTVPTLVLIGELDDWTLAAECRKMAEGRDDYGISRQEGQGSQIKLVVYPGAYHAFDAINFTTPTNLLGHHLEFNQAATDRSIDAVREFLDATIGGKGQIK